MYDEQHLPVICSDRDSLHDGSCEDTAKYYTTTRISVKQGIGGSTPDIVHGLTTLEVNAKANLQLLLTCELLPAPTSRDENLHTYLVRVYLQHFRLVIKQHSLPRPEKIRRGLL
ncbi:hypothetical protein J3F83DRAFT_349852 [Trichoderma novae-zelandiae]